MTEKQVTKDCKGIYSTAHEENEDETNAHD